MKEFKDILNEKKKIISKPEIKALRKAYSILDKIGDAGDEDEELYQNMIDDDVQISTAQNSLGEVIRFFDK